MELNVESLLDKVLSNLKSEAKTETVIGEEFKLGAFTCVPIIKIGMGFGGGGGVGDSPKKGSGTGGGAGAGMAIAPVAFLVTKGDDISLINVGQSKGINAMFEKLPDLLEKYMDQQQAKENQNSESSTEVED